jgi:gliding motility-associated-like protein
MSTPANQASATFTAAGVYSLVVTNTLTGCVNTFTNAANTFTVIEDNATPTFTLGTASSVTTTCASPNATLTANSSLDPNTVYTWLTPSSTTLTGTPISVSAAGIYSLVVTNTVNGCTNSSSVSQNTVEVVTGTGIPVVAMSSTSVSITCSNPTPSVSISTTSTPVSYNWSPSSGILPGTETTDSPVFTTSGSYSVIVTNTVSGCASGINTNVVTVTNDNAAPVITLSSLGNADTITCASPSVVINPGITTSGSLSDLTYTWSPSGVISTSINDATFTSAGVYTLAITNTLTGCVTTSTNSANIFTVYGGTIIPTANILPVSTNSTIGCAGTSSFVTLSSSATATNVINTWLPDNVLGSQYTATVQGTYSLVTVDAITGCRDTTDFTVMGNTNPPQGVDAGTSANITCGNSSTTLAGASTSTNVSYNWSGPSATSIISGNTTATPLVGETGTYTLIVTDNSTGCQSTATVTVTQANVVASFTANPTTGTAPLTVNFTDSSVGATNWSWDFGDFNTSSTQNPTNVYTSGNYTVTLTASSGTCTSTATVVIVVEDGLTMEIPNVFTPNGDDVNDIFYIKSTGIKEISLQIFNRWGEKLYEFSGPKASWDGLAPNGQEVPEGTYFYFVKATGFDDTEIEKHGSVNLFR